MSSSTTPIERLPPLPIELWTRIIASVTKESELGRLWLTCRRVSHLVQAATETAFVQQHLRRTRIYFDLGCVLLDDENKCSLSVNCEFDRLSGDGERAFFRDRGLRAGAGDAGGLDQDARRETVDKWREAVAMFLGDGKTDRRYDMPPYIICLRRMVMDTDLPGLRVDYREKEVSFQWKKALSLFFGELEYIRAIKTLEMSEKEDEVAALKDQYHRGEVNAFSILLNGFSMMENLSEKVSQRVRRLRFRRWHRRHGSPLPREWFEEEAYEEREKLRQLREMKDAETYGDEEDHEEQEGKVDMDGTRERGCELDAPGSDREALGLDINAYYVEDADEDLLPGSGSGRNLDMDSDGSFGLLGRRNVRRAVELE